MSRFRYKADDFRGFLRIGEERIELPPHVCEYIAGHANDLLEEQERKCKKVYQRILDQRWHDTRTPPKGPPWVNQAVLWNLEPLEVKKP